MNERNFSMAEELLRPIREAEAKREVETKRLSQDKFMKSIWSLVFAVDAQLNYVRGKYNIEGNNFDCPYLKKMAEAQYQMKKLLGEK